MVEVTDEDTFDCTYDEWAGHLRADVRRTAHEDGAHGIAPAVQTNNDLLLAEKIERAKTVGLEDGTRIETRSDGWVVVDSFLHDSEDTAWVAGDDEDMPPTTFPSAAAAYRAWERVEKAWAARMQQREEALKRLEKKSG